MSDVQELAPEEGGKQRAAAQEGEREPGAGQEDDREPGASQEGDRKPEAGQEGDREPGAEVVREPGVQEDAREPGTSQEGVREPSTGHEDAREHSTGQKDAREHDTGQEDAREHGTGQEDAREHGTGQEDAREHDTGQEDAREHGTGQEDAREHGTGQEDAREHNTIQEDAREHGTSHRGDVEPGTLVDVEREQSAEEESRSIVNEENDSSQQQSEEVTESMPTVPNPQSAEQAVISENGELEAMVEADQRGPYTVEYQEIPSYPSEDQEEDTQPHGDKQEEEEDDDKHQGETEQLQDNTEPQESPRDTFEVTQAQEALIQQYHALVLEREKVQQQNAQLQHKLYEYFRRKKGEEVRPETEKHISDQEQRYLKYLTTLEEMRKKYKEDAACHEQQIEELQRQCQEVVSQIDREWTAFQEQKKKVALYGGSRRGIGKHATSSFAQEVEQLQSKEDRKEKEVIQVRLENIKLKNQIHRYDSALRSREELADGLHLIDFEQLKIENQTYNEKIEERNEELLKLRKKITNTVQVLTHLKEKLQFVQAENHQQKEKLMEVEALVANKRDILTKTKQARDSLRMDNLKLKQQSGLLGNKILLRDFEDKVDATENLSRRLESLQRRHAELTLSSKGIMKKIDEAKLVLEG